MVLTAKEKKFVVLARLTEGDRIIRQRPSECGTLPDAAWFLRKPQGRVWISTLKYLERHGLIIESIAPTDDAEYMRRYYQSDLKHRVYAITQEGWDWFMGTDAA